jgi:WD repeat-containing protein 23
LQIFGLRYKPACPSTIALCAGGNAPSVFILDLETMQVVTNSPRTIHDESSVAYLDRQGNVICCGGDDFHIKLWDVRMRMGPPIGVLEGHMDGITSISTTLDDIHILSNSKDQTAKLFDARRLVNVHETAPVRALAWDYRFMAYPGRHLIHPSDSSLVTYSGHDVLLTHIRCGFSPAYTGNRFVFNASASRGIHVYSRHTGRLLNRMVLPFQSVIRECAWHPHQPLMVAATFNGHLLAWDVPRLIGADDEF